MIDIKGVLIAIFITGIVLVVGLIICQIILGSQSFDVTMNQWLIEHPDATFPVNLRN